MNDHTHGLDMQLDTARGDQLVRMFLDQTLMGVLLVDESGTVVEWNSACERLTGKSRQETIGRPYADVQFEFLPPERRTEERRQQLQRIVLEGLRTGVVAHRGVVEFRFVQPDGTEMYGEQIFYPIRTEKGFAFASVVQDVTERKRVEREKQTLESQLAHAVKLEAMGRLAGGMAHDFNNLLTVILGYSSVLTRRATLDPSCRETLREIESAATRAAALTSQLLAFSRRQIITPRRVDVNQIVAGVSRMLTRVLGEELSLVLNVGSEVPPIEVDPSQLEHALINLAVNARDAMAGGGTLTVETSQVRVGQGFCRTHLDAVPGLYACLSVTDTGCGMSEDTRAHLFEPFFTTKELGKGTGLGLSTIYGFVKQVGGFINVYSEPGIGTVIRLYFPAVEGKARGETPPPVKSPPAGVEHILVAEDETPVREFVRRVLQGAGYTVHVATRPSEATALARAPDFRIDLLLSDMVMPEMSGRDLWERLRGARPNMRVVFMSGYARGTVADTSDTDRTAKYLEKPFTIDTLLTTVREALDR